MAYCVVCILDRSLAAGIPQCTVLWILLAFPHMRKSKGFHSIAWTQELAHVRQTACVVVRRQVIVVKVGSCQPQQPRSTRYFTTYLNLHQTLTLQARTQEFLEIR